MRGMAVPGLRGRARSFVTLPALLQDACLARLSACHPWPQVGAFNVQGAEWCKQTRGFNKKGFDPMELSAIVRPRDVEGLTQDGGVRKQACTPFTTMLKTLRCEMRTHLPEE